MSWFIIEYISTLGSGGSTPLDYRYEVVTAHADELASLVQ